MNNILIKFFTLIFKFLFFPVSVFSTLYLDIFDIDFFNKKKIIELNLEISQLKELNATQSTELKNNSNILKENSVQSYDIKQIVIYTGALITTGICIYLAYNFFFSSGDAFINLSKQNAVNTDIVIETLKSQHQLSNKITAEIGNNMIQTTKELNTDTISILTDVAKTVNINNSTQGTEILSSSLTVINNNIANLNQGFSQNIIELTNYIYQNVSQKINRVDANLIRSIEILNTVVDSMNSSTSIETLRPSEAPIWGEGHILGSDPVTPSAVVPAEPILNPSGFTLSPSDLEYE